MLIFQALKDRNGDDERVAKLLEYVESTWLQSTVWSLADISLFMRSVRTNNDVEGCDNPTRNHAELAIIASWVTQLGIISSSVVPTSNC